MLTVPAACFGVLNVHLVVLVQVASISFDPITTMSAPAIGRKPEPVTVTFVPPAAGPDVGEMLVILSVFSLVAYASAHGGGQPRVEHADRAAGADAGDQRGPETAGHVVAGGRGVQAAGVPGRRVVVVARGDVVDDLGLVLAARVDVGVVDPGDVPQSLRQHAHVARAVVRAERGVVDQRGDRRPQRRRGAGAADDRPASAEVDDVPGLRDRRRPSRRAPRGRSGPAPPGSRSSSSSGC